MCIQLRFLSQQGQIRDLLRCDGWTLESDQNEVLAHHSAVNDQVGARNRLQRLGLLTSSSLQINFPPERRKKPTVLIIRLSGRAT